MYKKSVQGWLKHLDFMILDVVVCGFLLRLHSVCGMGR